MPTHDITPAAAAVKTQNFQTAYPGRFKGGKLPKSDILDILNQANCVELRYFFTLDDVNKPNEITVVFVGVDGSGNDMIAANNFLKDSVMPCPTVCGVSNMINHNP